MDSVLVLAGRKVVVVPPELRFSGQNRDSAATRPGWKTLSAWSAAFLALTYLPYLAPARAAGLPGLMAYWSVWCSTAIILCDVARGRIEGASLLEAVTRNWNAFFRFVATGAVCGLLLDGSAQWLCKLWIYPYWNTALYAGTFVLGFCAYCLLLSETYFLARAVTRRFLPRPRAVRRARRWLPYAAAGAALACAGIALGLRDYAREGGYRFAIAAPTAAHAAFSRFLLVFGGAWLFLEGVLSFLGRQPLTGALRARDWAPLAAALGAGWGFGFLMETANAAQHFWRYTNWPLESTAPFGVPVATLAAWPVQYLVFLSVFGALGGQEAWT